MNNSALEENSAPEESSVLYQCAPEIMFGGLMDLILQARGVVSQQVICRRAVWHIHAVSEQARLGKLDSGSANIFIYDLFQLVSAHVTTERRLVKSIFRHLGWGPARKQVLTIPLLFINLKLDGMLFPRMNVMNVTFRNCDFSSASLIEGRFVRCTFEGCKFDGAAVTESNFGNSTLVACSFRRADLSESDFTNVKIRSCVFEDAVIDGAIGLSIL
jgi:hypothetical protein